MTPNQLFKAGLYVSIHSRINKSSGIDYDELNVLLEEMENDGWEQTEFDDLIIGNRIRYIVRYERGSHDKFIAGGFIISKNEEYLTYLSGKSWTLRREDIIQIWKREGTPLKRKKPVNKPELITFKKPDPKGKYEAIINGIIVYRTSDKSKYERFQNTTKYAKALINGFEVD